MFGAAARGEPLVDEVPVVDDWGLGRRLEAERESLGLYLSGHPFDQYRADATYIASGSVAALASAAPPPPGSEYQPGRDAMVAGLVTNLRKRTGRITAEIDDGTGVIEISIFPETYERCRNHLGAHSIVVVTGQLALGCVHRRVAARGQGRLGHRPRDREARASRLLIRWSNGRESRMDATRLRRALEPFRPGNCGIWVYYSRSDAQARLTLGDDWTVRPSRELRERLSELVGADGFRFVYDVGQQLH